MTSTPAWIADRPRNWRAIPFRYLYRRTKRVGYENETLLSVYRDHGVVDKSTRSDNFNNASEDLGPYQLVNVGDLAINKMKAWQGSVAVSPIRGIVSPAYFVYTPTHHEHSGYLHYLLRSAEYTRLYQLYSKGIRVNQWDLDPSVHGSMPVLLPPVEEQRRIAEFLDRETAQIDELIAKQEQLISTLAERRSAAVTKQVLGAPRWELQPLRWEIEFITSGSRGWAEFYSDTGAPFIRIGNLPRQSLELKRDDIQYVDIPAGTEGVRAVTQEGDLLFSITAYLGSVSVVDSADAGSYVSQHVALVRLRARRFLPRYVGYVALSVFGQQQLALGAYGGTKIQLSLEDIKSFVVPRPSLSEQEQIVRELDDLLADTDQLIGAAGSAISLLRERRQALISAAVTGQIDVGGAS